MPLGLKFSFIRELLLELLDMFPPNLLGPFCIRLGNVGAGEATDFTEGEENIPIFGPVTLCNSGKACNEPVHIPIASLTSEFLASFQVLASVSAMKKA